MLPTNRTSHGNHTRQESDQSTSAHLHPKLNGIMDEVIQAISKAKEHAAERREQRDQAQKVEREQSDADKARIEQKIARDKQEAEDSIRADERRRINAEQKTARLIEYSSHIMSANTLKISGNYDNAIIAYYAALSSLHASKSLVTTSVVLELLLGPTYQYTDIDPAHVCMNIAECHMLKKDYITAIKCYKKINFVDSTISGLQHEIELCNRKIAAQFEGILKAAQIAHKNGNDNEVKKQLNKARDFSKRANLHNATYEIDSLEKRFHWIKVRASVAAGYDRLNKIDLSSYTGEYKEILMPIYAIERLYQQNVYNCDADDNALIERIIELKKCVTILVKQQQLKTEWLSVKDPLLNLVKNVVDMHNKYDQEQLQNLTIELNSCCKKFKKFSKVISSSELEIVNQAYTLAFELKILLQQKIAREKREYERLNNLRIENAISKNLDNAHQYLLLDSWELAIIALKSARINAAHITCVDDISFPYYKDINCFDFSIMQLEEHLQQYNIRSKVRSKSHAIYIVNTALNGTTLLERHHERLISNIHEELQANWNKFDQRSKSEYENLFNTIIAKISGNLVDTSFGQRLGNWSSAAYCIHQGKSKLIAPEIRILIKEYKAASEPQYIQLPIITQHVAKKVPTAAEAQASSNGATSPIIEESAPEALIVMPSSSRIVNTM